MRWEQLDGELRRQLAEGSLFSQAKAEAMNYLQALDQGRVSPDEAALQALEAFDGPMPECVEPSPETLLEMLRTTGAKATVKQSGGRYFGFVNGGNFPVALAARWMADAWDQNSALYVMSPIASKLEEVCERWLVSLFRLPAGTAAGFVSGSSTAILCALAAARDELLRRQGWDVCERGLFGAPPLRVVLGEQAHSSVIKALSLLGVGKAQLTFAPVDGQGRIIPGQLPELDAYTLLIAQAGNVNGGAFDPLDMLADRAREAGAWMHIDGAFGLWAAACPVYARLTAGMERADSWSADAHKTLNVPYDSGIVLCRQRDTLVRAMQATGSYIQYSDHRDGMLYTPEMSRRARGVELWATLRYLGREGVALLVEQLCRTAVAFAGALREQGFMVENEVVFNQIVVRCESDALTAATLRGIQAGGVCWCGGAKWQGRGVIRISVCSWRTTAEDVAACVAEFVRARDAARAGG